MNIKSLKPGMIVYDVRKEKMGNTTISTVSVREVKIIRVDVDAGVVEYSWNGNRPSKHYGSTVPWRKSKPILVSRGYFGHRLATREEIAKMKEGAK